MTRPKLKMVCSRCGSENVRADAYAEWDVDNQKWELTTTFDKGSVCEDCEETDCIEEVEIKDDDTQNTE